MHFLIFLIQPYFLVCFWNKQEEIMNFPGKYKHSWGREATCWKENICISFPFSSTWNKFFGCSLSSFLEAFTQYLMLSTTMTTPGAFMRVGTISVRITRDIKETKHLLKGEEEERVWGNEGPTVFTLCAKHVDSNKNHVGSNFGQRKNTAA